MEPLIGSLLGLALGVGSMPGLNTCLGGAILIASTVVGIRASYRREQAEALEVPGKPPPSEGGTGGLEVDGKCDPANESPVCGNTEEGEDGRKPLVAQAAKPGVQIEMTHSEPES